jgi:hypothetical protein
MSWMDTYTVILKVDCTGFHVAIVGSNGVRQTLLGFETRADAEAWILRDKCGICAPLDAVHRKLLGRSDSGLKLRLSLLSKLAQCDGFWDVCGYSRMAQNHSHSIVPGGLLVMS